MGFVAAQHGAQRTYALLTLANKLVSQCEVQVNEARCLAAPSMLIPFACQCPSSCFITHHPLNLYPLHQSNLSLLHRTSPHCVTPLPAPLLRSTSPHCMDPLPGSSPCIIKPLPAACILPLAPSSV